MEVLANNKTVVLRLIDEVLNKGNLTATDQLLDPNFVLHLPGSQEPEDAISEGDKVAVRVTQQGTHQGVFQGVNGTGTRVSVSAIAFFRVANGRVAEEWLSSDRLGLHPRSALWPPLGSLPRPGKDVLNVFCTCTCPTARNLCARPSGFGQDRAKMVEYAPRDCRNERSNDKISA